MQTSVQASIESCVQKLVPKQEQKASMSQCGSLSAEAQYRSLYTEASVSQHASKTPVAHWGQNAKKNWSCWQFEGRVE